MFHTIFSDILRFRISVFLLQNTADFVTLREKFEVTDGNLSFHLKKLENEKIIELSKNFVGKKPQTSVKITDDGRKKILEHLDFLETIIKESK